MKINTGGLINWKKGSMLFFMTIIVSWSFAQVSFTGKVTGKNGEGISAVSVVIKNTGIMEGDEVSQVYIKYPAIERMPLKELKSFKRVYVQKGGAQTVQFRIPVTELQKWDLQQKKWMLYPGDYTISIGSSSQDIKLNAAIKVKAGMK